MKTTKESLSLIERAEECSPAQMAQYFCQAMRHWIKYGKNADYCSSHPRVHMVFSPLRIPFLYAATIIGKPGSVQ